MSARTKEAQAVLKRWRADGSEHKLAGGVVPLISGLGGNPYFLDTLEQLLQQEGVWYSLMGTHAYVFANQFADAILEADAALNGEKS